MLPDHYATLGVAPNCGRAAIRAAYLELMRRYHPDRNPSAAAAAHVHAITAAYAILGVPERRELYDRDRARLRAANAAAFVPDRPRARLSPWIAAPFAIAALALLVPTLVTAPVTPPAHSGATPAVDGGGDEAGAKDMVKAVAPRQQAAAPRISAPASVCESPSAARRVERELFSRAAQLRGSDQAAFAGLAEHSLVRIESPRVTDSRRPGDVRCSASFALELPPGVAAGGGLRSLTGLVSYSLQRDGRPSSSFNLVSEGRIVRLLASVREDRTTLRERADPASTRRARDERPELAAQKRPTVRPAPRQTPAAGPQRAAVQQNPSFSCDLAKSWAAIWVCNSAGLAALDREMASLYGSAMGQADAAKRQILLSSHNRFVARRNACTSESCVESAYSGRLREIRNIMTDAPPAR